MSDELNRRNPMPKPAPKKFDAEGILARIERNEELVRDFKSVIGSNDLSEADRVRQRVADYAKEIEPELSISDADRFALLLLAKIKGVKFPP